MKLLKRLKAARQAAGDTTFPVYLSELKEAQRRRPTMMRMLAAARLD